MPEKMENVVVVVDKPLEASNDEYLLNRVYRFDHLGVPRALEGFIKGIQTNHQNYFNGLDLLKNFSPEVVGIIKSQKVRVSFLLDTDKTDKGDDYILRTYYEYLLKYAQGMGWEMDAYAAKGLAGKTADIFAVSQRRYGLEGSEVTLTPPPASDLSGLSLGALSLGEQD